MAAHFPYAFEAEIEHHDLGSYRYTVTFLPPDIAEALPFDSHSRLRISGELNDHPLSGAWQPSRGRWYLMLGKPLLRAAGVVVGDVVELRFRLEDQDEVDMPPGLTGLLAADHALAQAWDALTTGKRRGLAQHILSAKTEATRAKRLEAVGAFLAAGESDLRKLAKSRRLR